MLSIGSISSHFRILVLAGTSILGFPALAAPSDASTTAQPGIAVYAGGVAGVDALTDPQNSAKFRQAGGGLYLHNSGWAILTPSQQQTVVSLFKGNPVALELGFKEGGTAWAGCLRADYLNRGIRPAFIAANAFDGNNKPTAAQWVKYTATLRAAGLPDSTLILPTFEFANFATNIATLPANTVSKRGDFQDMITAARGIVLDVPPAFFFAREENYRAWVIDAIKWTRERHLTVVWIASPHTAPGNYRADTMKFLSFMARRDAMPTAIVCENYNAKPPRDFPAVVGSEDGHNSALGVAWSLLSQSKSLGK